MKWGGDRRPRLGDLVAIKDGLAYPVGSPPMVRLHDMRIVSGDRPDGIVLRASSNCVDVVVDE